jgi:hypothetical protein
MRWFLGSALLLSLTSARDISLLLFDDTECNGDISTNVHSNPANEHAGSGCIATNFKSAGVASVDEGFQCNLYADTACQNFIGTVKTLNQCDTLVGQGAICFSQISFENPLADVKAVATVGKIVLEVTAEVNPSGFAGNTLRGACNGNACDPNQHFNTDLFLSQGAKWR